MNIFEDSLPSTMYCGAAEISALQFCATIAQELSCSPHFGLIVKRLVVVMLKTRGEELD
jgi:hypothetical protein